MPETIDISPIVKPISIKNPNKAVPKAVANTINAVVSALIDPIYLTPYNSAQVEDPNIFANPFEIPTNPKNINAVMGVSKKNKTITESKSGIFIKIKSFLLLNLSIKNPEINRVRTEKIE
jgi:hypothetical protein